MELTNQQQLFSSTPFLLGCHTLGQHNFDFPQKQTSPISLLTLQLYAYSCKVETQIVQSCMLRCTVWKGRKLFHSKNQAHTRAHKIFPRHLNYPDVYNCLQMRITYQLYFLFRSFFFVIHTIKLLLLSFLLKFHLPSKNIVFGRKCNLSNLGTHAIQRK